MIDKLIYNLYLKNYFRLAIYIVKFLSIFNNQYKKKINFFNYFKKRKKNYERNVLKLIYKPKIFIFKFSENLDEVLNQVYNHDNLFQKNEFTKDGHINVYQSEHNLEKNKKFKKFSKILEKFINKKLQNFLINKELRIIKLWFVITKKLGVIKKHGHFNSDFSGVLYLNIEENNEIEDGLKIYNPLEIVEIFQYTQSKKTFNKSVCFDKEFILKPKKNDIIIFNSYLEHSVNNKSISNIDRVSLPFDLIV